MALQLLTVLIHVVAFIKRNAEVNCRVTKCFPHGELICLQMKA